MTDLLAFLLSLLVTYGAISIAVVMFLSGLGLPLPATALILAAGSLTGSNILEFWSVVFLVALSAAAGDVVSYSIARRSSGWVQKFTRHLGITPAHLASVDTHIQSHGRWYIFLSRWLITPLAPTVNIVTGLRHFPIVSFILYSILGEFLWAFLGIYLGHVLGASWSSIVTIITTGPDVIALLFLSLVSALLAWKIYQRKSKRSK